HDPGDRFVWSDAAAAGWRADSSGGALEVRIQKYQVDREDYSRRRTAADHLEHRRAERVRLLFKRESECRSSPLEPGARATHRRIQRPRDLDVQWIWRTGRASV